MHICHYCPTFIQFRTFFIKIRANFPQNFTKIHPLLSELNCKQLIHEQIHGQLIIIIRAIKSFGVFKLDVDR